jgi:gluconate 5-dehydrogenase
MDHRGERAAWRAKHRSATCHAGVITFRDKPHHNKLLATLHGRPLTFGASLAVHAPDIRKERENKVMSQGIDLFKLTGQRALITGAGQGIGFALARGLAQAGASVVINDRDAVRAANAVAKLRDEGLSAVAAVFDVTCRDEVLAAIEQIESESGAVNILVNNAGMQRRAPLEDFSPDDWDALLQVNLSSVFHVSQAVARHMIGRRAGKIINICSVQSALARPTIAPYTATKGAVAMFTKGQCTDWAKHGIQVNGIAPGYFITELTQALADNETFSSWLCARTPAGRWGRVSELIGTAIFLASSASDFVNGQVVYVDGGLTSCV